MGVSVRICPHCGLELPLTAEHFNKGSRRNGGFDYHCKPCARAKNKRYRDSYNGRRKRTDSRYKRVFGISLAEAEEMLDLQGGGCGICRNPLDWTTFCVDHCHDTGRVRGILCGTCNSGIGMLRDDWRIVQAAVDYLKQEIDGELDVIDPFDDDEPIFASCDLSNPDVCESCT